ncbi:hypothetical protein BJY00DRAFT_312120 [Aspergillus carlsbadensis]|nr:hypothetical protein BJY00DRAFT_312120 [Aspergillus carlsbadensis]
MIPLKRKLHAGHEIVQYLTKRIKGHRPASHPGISHAGLFEKLPPELIEVIAISSDCGGICALRLICTYIKNSTLHAFETNYSVQTIRTDFSKESFKRISELCELRHLALKVEKVHVTTRKYYGRGFKWKRTGRDDIILMKDQGAVTEWYQLFLKLVNCRNFSLSQGMRDGSNASKELLTKGDALMLLCYIIGVVGIPVQSFYTQMPVRYGLWLRYGRTEFFDTPQFLKAWASIESLTLDDVPLEFTGSELFLHLIASATSLKRLELRSLSQDEIVNAAARTPLTLQELRLIVRAEFAEGLPPRWWTVWIFHVAPGICGNCISTIYRLAAEGVGSPS